MRKHKFIDCLVVVLASALLLLGCGDSLSEEQIQGILRDVEHLGGDENPLSEEPSANTDMHIPRVTADSELFSNDIDIWSEWRGRLAQVSGTVIDVYLGIHTADVTLLVGNKSVDCEIWAYPDAAVLRDMAKQRQWVTIRGVLVSFNPGKLELDGCQFWHENPEEPSANTDMHIPRVTADSELFSNDIDIWSEWRGRLAQVSGTVIDVYLGIHTADVTLLVGNKSVDCEIWAYPDAAVLRDMAKQRQWVTIRGVLVSFNPGKLELDGCQFWHENPEENAP